MIWGKDRRADIMEKKILDELVKGVLCIFQNSVVQIILYGSVARGTNTEESDVDVAILMNSAMDEVSEELLSEFIVDMNLKYDKVFSVIDIEYDLFQKWENVIPFYNNVAKEGVVLWKAA